MRILLLLLIPVVCFGQRRSTPPLTHYLPAAVNYNPQIPTPVDVLGRELGSWHFTAIEIEVYMRALAKASDRVAFEEIGYSHEGRRLYVLFISSSANQNRREEIRLQHLRLSDPRESGNVNIENEPVVVWQGHTIHGNEPSGSHAAMVYAYHLAAAQDEQTRNWLDQAIVILDPCMNPDGLQRFATWVNSHNSVQTASDPASREFHEAWPGGRTNHYWFDLNRDWLPAVHPESRARLSLFHAWKPNVLTDHHEMGGNSTYFFQPGVPSRNNPLTPANTFALTHQLAAYHAAALDSIGSTYFTGERFDDFYYGKGSTYPDVNGAVGILFEQASSRGHAQETSNGLLTFPFTIRNQVNTSFSTIKGAIALRDPLLQHQRDFYKEALELGRKDKAAGWVFTNDGDPLRAQMLLELMERHQIKCEVITEDVKINGLVIKKEQAFFIPNAQPQYRLITSVFEKRTTFTDSLFYDVSAWNMPLAFGLPFVQTLNKNFGTRVYAADFREANKSVIGGESSIGYLLAYNHYQAPAAVLELLQKGLLVKAAMKPFKDASGIEMPAGTIFIPAANQALDPEGLYTLLGRLIRTYQIEIRSIRSGLNMAGINLGSNDMQNLELPRVAVLVGQGVNPYEAGEIWHLFDQRWNLPVTLLETNSLSPESLGKYNTLILPGGSYSGTESYLREFIQSGGLVIGQKRALFTINQLSQGLVDAQFPNNGHAEPDHFSYEERQRFKGAQVIGGAIFEAELDLTHPLCFGFQEKRQALFKNSTIYMNVNGSATHYPVTYAKSPLMAGYASASNLVSISGKAAIAAHPVGKGRVVAFADVPSFRGFWLGSERFMANAILFGRLID